MNATVRNMRAVEDQPGVFAYDISTGDRYSATPGDYFWQPEDEPLTGEDGNPLILAYERCEVIEVNTA